jgi:hypothetical protein
MAAVFSLGCFITCLGLIDPLHARHVFFGHGFARHVPDPADNGDVVDWTNTRTGLRREGCTPG